MKQSKIAELVNSVDNKKLKSTFSDVMTSLDWIVRNPNVYPSSGEMELLLDNINQFAEEVAKFDPITGNNVASWSRNAVTSMREAGATYYWATYENLKKLRLALEKEKRAADNTKVFHMRLMLDGLAQFLPASILPLSKNLSAGNNIDWETFTSDYQNALLKNASSTVGNEIKVADEQWIKFQFAFPLNSEQQVRSFTFDEKGQVRLKLDGDTIQVLGSVESGVLSDLARRKEVMTLSAVLALAELISKNDGIRDIAENFLELAKNPLATIDAIQDELTDTVKKFFNQAVGKDELNRKTAFLGRIRQIAGSMGVQIPNTNVQALDLHNVDVKDREHRIGTFLSQFYNINERQAKYTGKWESKIMIIGALNRADRKYIQKLRSRYNITEEEKIEFIDHPGQVLHAGQSKYADMDITVHAWNSWEDWKGIGTQVYRFVDYGSEKVYEYGTLLQNIRPKDFAKNVFDELSISIKEQEVLERQQ